MLMLYMWMGQMGICSVHGSVLWYLSGRWGGQPGRKLPLYHALVAAWSLGRFCLRAVWVSGNRVPSWVWVGASKGDHSGQRARGLGGLWWTGSSQSNQALLEGKTLILETKGKQHRVCWDSKSCWVVIWRVYVKGLCSAKRQWAV